MNERKDYRAIAALIIEAITCFVLWAILICLKAAGVDTMHWPLVLSGIVWLPCIMYAGTVLVAAIVIAFAKLKRWSRQRKTDKRIIAQAKAAGVWNRTPIVLGGRALELKAWKEHKIKRRHGEPDAILRYRYSNLETMKRKAREQGLKIKKVKTDGYSAYITLYDENHKRGSGENE